MQLISRKVHTKEGNLAVLEASESRRFRVNVKPIGFAEYLLQREFIFTGDIINIDLITTR